MTRRYTLDYLARLIDHTNLHPDATEADMEKLCDEARRYHFKMVAINSGQSARCAALLAGTDIHVGAAISFPLGQTSIAAKVFETQDAIEDVALMRKTVGDRCKVKAAGGIRDADTFLDMVRAGATRIGCSAGIPIIEELRRRFEERGIDSIEL